MLATCILNLSYVLLLQMIHLSSDSLLAPSPMLSANSRLLWTLPPLLSSPVPSRCPQLRTVSFTISLRLPEKALITVDLHCLCVCPIFPHVLHCSSIGLSPFDITVVFLFGSAVTDVILCISSRNSSMVTTLNIDAVVLSDLL